MFQLLVLLLTEGWGEGHRFPCLTKIGGFTVPQLDPNSILNSAPTCRPIWTVFLKLCSKLGHELGLSSLTQSPTCCLNFWSPNFGPNLAGIDQTGHQNLWNRGQ